MPDPTEYKRIIELPPTSVIAADDQLPVDSETNGSRKISWPDLLDLIIGEAEEATDAALAAQAAAETARDLAIAAKNTAVAAAGSAATDAGSTSADRTAVAIDRAAADGDAIATAADRAAVASDKTTVAADKATVAADKTTVAADRAAADADAVATAADRVQTGSDKTATAADRVQTGLDRIQTGTDRTAASGSATAAAGSATAAAGSATTALNAIAQAFKGGVAGAAVPATSPLAGDYYRITSAGASQSKTWVIGDAAIYNGTSGSWTQLTGYFLAATTSTPGTVQLATPAQSDAGISAIAVLTPAAIFGRHARCTRHFDVGAFTFTKTGTASNALSGFGLILRTGITSGSTFTPTTDSYWVFPQEASSHKYFDWSKPIGFSLPLEIVGGSTNGVIRFLITSGYANVSIALASYGYGAELRNGVIWLVAHDGTTLSQKNTGLTYTTGTTQYKNLWVFASGGTVYLYNGSALVDSVGGCVSTGLQLAALMIGGTNGVDSTDNGAFLFRTIDVVFGQ